MSCAPIRVTRSIFVFFSSPYLPEARVSHWSAVWCDNKRAILSIRPTCQLEFLLSLFWFLSAMNDSFCFRSRLFSSRFLIRDECIFRVCVCVWARNEFLARIAHRPNRNYIYSRTRPVVDTRWKFNFLTNQKDTRTTKDSSCCWCFSVAKQYFLPFFVLLRSHFEWRAEFILMTTRQDKTR